MLLVMLLMVGVQSNKATSLRDIGWFRPSMHRILHAGSHLSTIENDAVSLMKSHVLLKNDQKNVF